LVSSAFGQKKVPEEAKRHFDYGTAATEDSKYELAIREFEQAVRLAPDWPEARYNLGFVQEKAEKYREAVASYKEYLRLAPDADDVEEVKSRINKLEYKWKTADQLSPDANTILLDHFENSTSASILGYVENGEGCGGHKPATMPAFSYGPGPDGLGQALTLEPPAGQPAGSASYLQYDGGQLLSQANGTIEFWVFLTSYGPGGANLVEQGPYYYSCGGWTFSMSVHSTGQLYVNAWDAFDMDSGAVTVPLNTWTHVAATWGSTGAKLYINGVQVGSDAQTRMPASGWGGVLLLRLGTTSGGAASIDELRISNIQRTWE
jgi:tetratricopeptide (TPR) repeat protein